MLRKDEAAPRGIKGPKPFPKLESGVRFPSLALGKPALCGLFCNLNTATAAWFALRRVGGITDFMFSACVYRL